MHPSIVISLNECPTAADSAARRTSGVEVASVVSTASIVAMFGASIAAPLAIPPTTKPSLSTATALVLVSVVKMALAAAWAHWSVEPRSPNSLGRAASILPTSRGTPIVPVEQIKISSTATASARADSSQVSSAARRPSAPVAAFAQPLFRTTAAVRPPLFSRLARADLHGRRRSKVGGEHRRARHRPRVGRRHEGEVQLAVRLDAGRAPRRHETARCENAHGTRPRVGRPAVSSSPRATLAAWMACPAPPFTRLSSAASATTCPVRAS